MDLMMAGKSLQVVMVCLLAAGVVSAADIQGTIVVERKLTKRNVTPAVGLYQRGVAVDLGADPAQDPLAFERSHVVVYLEDAPASPLSAPAKPPTIEQRDRRFSPDLVAI